MGTNIDEFYDKAAIPDGIINKTSSTNDNSIGNQMLSGNLENDLQQLKILFDKSFDIVYR
jgi:hypothetical protein